ncbi:hypothetical protein ACOMCU_16270 [Lysinibacillus sp. UGB7]|uniref:hypothetical protein n=1 Tax=Lysinibacillus sp. UGB7 TaxID=3411039 RepID=UPI003B7C1011
MKIADCCFCKEPVYECSSWNITERYDIHHIECAKKERERIIVRNYEMKENATWQKEHNRQINNQLKGNDNGS